MIQEIDSNEMRGRLVYPGEIRKYVLGGNATFTLAQPNQRFTYRVRSTQRDRLLNWSTTNQDKSRYFVNLLVGSDNESAFQYLGMMQQVRDGSYNFMATKASRIGVDAQSFNLFLRFWNVLEIGCSVASDVEFWHEGSCCRCGRKLTVPESIAAGIGPECASKGE